MKARDRVAQLLEHWTSFQISQVEVPLWGENFSGNPKWLILRVASLQQNIILLTKVYKNMRNIIFGKLNIEGT